MTKNKHIEAVSIPASVYKQLERRVSVTEFDSVDAYVTFVLEELLVNLETTDDAESAVGEEEMKSRLRALGYLDE